MEQLPVRSYAAGVGLVSLALFTGILGWGHAGRLRAADVKTPAPVVQSTPKTADPPRPATVTQPPPKAEEQPKVHVVKDGETLWGIATSAGIGIADLLALNPDASPEHLQIGEELKLPPNARTGSLPAEDEAVTVARLQGKFIWPVVAPITSEFGPRWGRMHSGLDIGAWTGDPIKAARDGEVIHAGEISGYGLTVILRHADGTRTLYAHASKLLVKVGQTIKQSQTIAEVGSTGHSTGPHLHFEVIVNDRAKDPKLFLPTLR